MSRDNDDINALFGGTTRLHRAAGGDSRAQVQELLDQGANPNARNFEGATPLHRAMDRNRWSDVDRALLKAGSDPNARDNFGATPLHYAAANASSERVDVLVKAGADPMARDNDGRTPLHRGHATGRADTPRVLIDAGADPNARDASGRPAMGGEAVPPERQAEYERTQIRINPPNDEGRTPLHAAARNGSFSEIHNLLQAGADPNRRDFDGAAPLHDAAIHLDAPEAVQTLILAGADPNARDADGLTPLHHAVGADQARSVEYLLQANAQVDFQDKDGLTPLHYASSNRSPEIADRLLEAGANTQLRDRRGRTPLDAIQNLRERPDPGSRADPPARDPKNPAAPQHERTPGQGTEAALLRAAEHQSALAVRVQLTAGADPNAANREGITALHFAAGRGNEPDAVKILLDAQADPNARDNRHSQTPLHSAVQAESTRAVDHLLNAGADPNARDNAGLTPLHEATFDSLAPETVHRLVQGGADPNIPDPKGSTPLHAAVQADSPEVVTHLINAKANPNIQDNNGRTPLHYSASVRSPELATQLLDAGADPTIRDRYGKTPADIGIYLRDRQTPNDRADDTIKRLLDAETPQHQKTPDTTMTTQNPDRNASLLRAAENGSVLGVRRQLAAGADPDASDRQGVTALHYAAGRADSPEAVKLLLDAKADPNVRDEYQGQTPLHLAVQADTPEAVKLLLDAKANPNVPDFDGGTALHYAAANRSPEIARDLIAAGGDPGREDLQGRTPRDLAHQDEPTRTALQEPRRAAAVERAGVDYDPRTLGTRIREAVEDRLPAPIRESLQRRNDRQDGFHEHQSEAQANEPRDTPRAGATPAHRTADDHYRQFADEIIKQMEKGAAPWQKPWQPGENRLPENFSTDARYQGGNVLQLMVKREQRGYADHRWGTYNQIKQAGGQVRKGERATTVLVYKPPRPVEGKESSPTERTDATRGERDLEKTGRPMWKRYSVFNVEQADGLKLPERKGPEIPPWEAQQHVETVIRANGVPIREVNGDRAAYNIQRDDIVLPERTQFKTAESFYQTALHEVGHSTGHPSRMNRESLQQGCKDGFGSPAYAREELRAEISAMMSSERLGVAYEPQHGTAYVASWIKTLEEDPKEIYRAAAEAGRISDYVCTAPERERAGALDKTEDSPGGERSSPERPIPAPAIQRQPQPAAAAKAPSIEWTR